MPIRVIITPLSTQDQIAMSWMRFAIGTASLPEPRNRLSSGVSNASSSNAITTVMTAVVPTPAIVIRPERSCWAAPAFCATIALTAMETAKAGICT